MDEVFGEPAFFPCPGVAAQVVEKVRQMAIQFEAYNQCPGHPCDQQWVEEMLAKELRVVKAHKRSAMLKICSV